MHFPSNKTACLCPQVEKPILMYYNKRKPMEIFTGWTLQIVATFKITLQLNYKTYRKNEDGFEIVRKRARKFYFSTYDLGPSLDPFERDLEQYGVLRPRQFEVFTLYLNAAKNILIIQNFKQIKNAFH